MNCCKGTPRQTNEALLLPKAERGVYTLLGLAQKAGRLAAGADAATLAAARGEARLLLLAADLSERTRQRLLLNWQELPGAKNAPIWSFGAKEALGQAAGRRPCGVWAFTDTNFASGLAAKLAALQQGGLAELIRPGR